MIAMRTWLNRWQISTVILVATYVFLVYMFLPLASLSITQNLPSKYPYNVSGITINETISNLADRDYFIVGDLAVFSFNITNTYGQPATFDYNSSVTFNQYGWPKSFTLNSYESKNITEELPLNSEGSNGFLFHVVGKISNSVDDLSISQDLKAISISDEISLVSQTSTFILTMIIGIPAIVYGVKEFRELGRKNPTK
jgi:hypothetical protein